MEILWVEKHHIVSLEDEEKLVLKDAVIGADHVDNI